jgi:PAS domain S-box-containing protein
VGAKKLGVVREGATAGATDIAGLSGWEPEAAAAAALGLAFAREFGGVHAVAWDRLADHVFGSAAFRALFGLPEAGRITVGMVESRLHPEDRDRVVGSRDALVARGGEGETEFRILLPDGEVRWILARGRTFVEGERFDGLVGVAIDITERKRVEVALAARETQLAAGEARLRIILDTMPQVVWSTRPDGHHDFYNARWHEFTGVPAGTTDGEGWQGMFHPEDQDRARQRWAHSVASGEPYEIEYRLRHHSGEYRWTLGRALPIRDASGAIERWFGTCTDIHDLKAAEEQRELIARELSHRIKNIFAVVSSLVALSARNAPEAQPFARVVRGRIDALARAHEYVRPHSPQSQPADADQTLLGLVGTLLIAYDERDRARIVITGVDARVGPHAATSFALVIHELATNAMKYGALSAAAGQVAITSEPRGDVLAVTWRETGGPEVPGAPTRRGFGTALSERALTAQLGAEIGREWRREGLVVRIRVPLAALGR